MKSRKADELIEKSNTDIEIRRDRAFEVLNFFLDNEGEFFERSAVVEKLSELLDISYTAADVALSDVVGDIVDPVQQIAFDGEKHVGVIEYNDFIESGSYGYIDYDDRKGKRKRVVCAKCVQDEYFDENITHATQNEGTCGKKDSWKQLNGKIKAHYNDSHSVKPNEIEIGASLVSGTTIAGNIAIHKGNRTSSGIDHDKTSNRTHEGDSIIPDSVESQTTLRVPVYDSVSDVPDSIEAGSIVFIKDENALYREDTR